MPAKNKAKILEALTDPEMESRMRTTLEAVLELQARKNVPRVFRNELCVKDNQFVHKYPDGKMFLIEQDQTDSSETILLQL